MEDSFKGLIISATMVMIFVAGILGFIIGFPEQQGMAFSEQDSETYLELQGIDIEGSSNLQALNNASDDSLEDWNIEVGFMGSNTQKGSKGAANTYATSTWTKIKIIGGTLFNPDNPVSWVLGILTILLSLYITYVFFKFVRTGN